MPDQQFWRQRFSELGAHSVGPGDTRSDTELNAHKEIFRRAATPWLDHLQGPVLDFGCGVGRWVIDLPRPYLGMDLLPEHIEYCKTSYDHLKDVTFLLSEGIEQIPDESVSSIFTVTVLQHVVEHKNRQRIIQQFHRILKKRGQILSIEWAQGQREFDWCTTVSRRDWKSYFVIKSVGEVVENGRHHTIWFGSKPNNLLEMIQAYLK